MAEPSLFLKDPRVSDIVENFGFEDPIGSVSSYNKLLFSLLTLTNLNAGTGDPWAGQVKAKPSESFFWNLVISDKVESLGFEEPIGSV